MCDRCRIGVETYCKNLAEAPAPGGGGGLGLDGGMADLMLVPRARHVVPLPEGLAPEQAAPLTDAGLTPYHAVRRSLAKLTPGTTAVVIGVGGLGHVAVQIIKAVSAASVVAVDTRTDALDLARSLGADTVVQSGDSAAEQIRAPTRGVAPTSSSTASGPTPRWRWRRRPPAPWETCPSSASPAAPCRCRSSRSPTR